MLFVGLGCMDLWNKPVEIWLDLINAKTEGDLEMIEFITNVKDIHDIIFTIREMSADEQTRYEAEMREKAIMDERSALTNFERRDLKKGIEEGSIKKQLLLLTG